MRRLVAALFVASLALALSGCGGSSSTTTSTETESVEVGSTSSVEAAASTIGTDTPEGDVFIEFPVTDETPQTVKDLLDEKQAFILFFFDSEQKVTDDTRKQIDKVAEDNEGLIEVYSYNLGSYTSVNSSDEVEVDTEALEKDDVGASIIALARDLGVSYTPHIVVVDTQGYIVYRQSGFIDADLLDRQVQRATE